MQSLYSRGEECRQRHIIIVKRGNWHDFLRRSVSNKVTFLLPVIITSISRGSQKVAFYDKFPTCFTDDTTATP
jgi:hypothetical protein